MVASRISQLVSFLVIALCTMLSVTVCDAFVLGSRAGSRMTSRSHISMEWKGDRPPLPNMEFLDQRMDAAWGRGKFRDEVSE